MGDLLQMVVPSVLAASGAILSATVAYAAPMLLSALSAHTGIRLAENQRQVILGAVQTAAGVLESSLDKGTIRTEHIQPLGAAVREQAQAALNAVPDAAEALGVTVPDFARMIVGRTNTAAHPPQFQSQLIPMKGAL